MVLSPNSRANRFDRFMCGCNSCQKFKGNMSVEDIVKWNAEIEELQLAEEKRKANKLIHNSKVEFIKISQTLTNFKL